MRTARTWTARLLSCALVVALCGLPELLQAQSAPPAPRRGISGEEPPVQDQRPQQEITGPTQNVAPQPAALPDAPSPSQAALIAQAQNNPAPASNVPPSQTPPAPATTPPSNTPAPPAQNKPAAEPVGAAAAQAGVTSGGAASRPAGMAIAPAKQHQVRSFLIKLGAIAAGGAAIGTVIALSKGSPSRPPGAK